MAIMLLGIPYGIISIVAVVTIQCFVFADGAASALGANILNMALVAAIPAIISVSYTHLTLPTKA